MIYINQEKSRRLINTLVRRLDIARKKAMEYQKKLKDQLAEKKIDVRCLPVIKKRLETQAKLSQG
jgi:hypothetical protein